MPTKLKAVSLCLSIALCSVPAGARTDAVKTAPESRAEVTLSFAPIVKKAQPAVVNVYASRTDARPRNPLFDDPIFRRFFGGGGDERPGGRTAQSLGSGVLVDGSGLVVTNYHVIENMTDVKVALNDKREFEAKIVLRDQRTDLALLKLVADGTQFPEMPLGDSDALEVGDLVLAIGNPFGVGQTVTQGIVSALARTNVGISDYGFFIQTDAAINPGNSGGALVDMSGRLAGINSAIFSQSGGSIGIGFAIPVNMVKIVVSAYKSGANKVHRPWLGASLQAVSREIADSLGLERPSGALVSDVMAHTAAEAAGIKRGDVIMAIDGKSVDNPESLGYRLGTKPIGGVASLDVLRSGKPLILSLKLTAAPEIPARDPVTFKSRSPFTGATGINLSPAVAEEYSLDNLKEGVVIDKIEDGSEAANVNLQKGDVILAVNDVKITSTRDLQTATEKRSAYWKLVLARGGQVLTSVLQD